MGVEVRLGERVKARLDILDQTISVFQQLCQLKNAKTVAITTANARNGRKPDFVKRQANIMDS